MFTDCELGKKKKCPFCGVSYEISYCGVAHGENKISLMKQCPLVKSDKKDTKGKKGR